MTSWGESEIIKRIRENAQQADAVTRCGVCNRAFKGSVREGREWFKRHTQTDEHRRGVKKR